MGNTSSPQNPSQKYSYFHAYEDSHFGPCNIYQQQNKHGPFVLYLRQVLLHNNASMIEKNHKSLFNSNVCGEMQNVFLRIFDFSIHSNQKIMGGKIINTCNIPSVNIWIEFLRHTLKQFLQWRKSQKKPLNANELIMVLSKSIKAYEMTKENEIFGPSLNVNDISVSIEGQMKFNPLLGKQFFTKTSKLENRGYRSCQSSPLRERIISKRVFRQLKENLYPKSLTFEQIRCISAYLPKDIQFLEKLKKFAWQIAIESGYQLIDEVKNPQDSQLDEGKQVKRFLNHLQRIKGLSEVKRFLGQTKIDRFDVDFAKRKHQQSEAKFSKILLEIQQRSQKTDYSYHELSNYVSPLKTYSSNKPQFFTPQDYRQF